jgi:Type II secretory pathway, component ExeA (predicted ATPase)
MHETAFLEFFGFREQPFGVTPDPRYLYLSSGHRDALASLHYGLESNCGFLALIAQPGMGKTTMLFHLLTKLDRNARTAFLFQNRCTAREFMRLLLAELGVDSDTQDFVRMHAQFNRCLLQEARAGRRVIIIVDEAQNLDSSVLEAIRLLSNFETPRQKLLQIILAGQPELADKLMRPSLSQLRQRITSVSGLSPLTAEETGVLITYRLQVAGYTGEPLFSPGAQDLIAEISQGIPRQINKHCFHVLWLAYGARKHTIDTEMVRTVTHRLDISQFASEIGENRPDNLGRMSANDTPLRSFDDFVSEMSESSENKIDSVDTSENVTSENLSREQAVLYMRNLSRRLHNRRRG